MNKKISSLCLLVVFILFTTVTCNSKLDRFSTVESAEQYRVQANSQSSFMNMMTFIHVQNQFFWCLMGSFTALFWADHGNYFRHCFNTFVAKPIFY